MRFICGFVAMSVACTRHTWALRRRPTRRCPSNSSWFNDTILRRSFKRLPTSPACPMKRFQKCWSSFTLIPVSIWFVNEIRSIRRLLLNLTLVISPLCLGHVVRRHLSLEECCGYQKPHNQLVSTWNQTCLQVLVLGSASLPWSSTPFTMLTSGKHYDYASSNGFQSIEKERRQGSR